MAGNTAKIVPFRYKSTRPQVITAAELRAVMRAAGLSMRDLGKIEGCHHSAVQVWCEGRGRVPLRIIVDLRQILRAQGLIHNAIERACARIGEAELRRLMRRAEIELPDLPLPKRQRSIRDYFDLEPIP